VCHHLDGGVGLAADDRPRPRFYGVKGYHHADFTHVWAMGHRQAAAVDRDVPVVAKTEECVE
jgi:hypothetical protein